MKYILSHGNIPIAELEIIEEAALIVRIGTVFAPEHIPIGISVNNGEPDKKDLNDWWQGRSIPASRQYIREAMEMLGVSSTEKLLTGCFGLSLSDQYWINPVNNPLEWSKVNFFDHPFSDDVGNILFGDDAANKKIDLVSPDNTSDGWLKKKWKIINGKRCLIKGGSDPYQQQPINEAMASIILTRLGIPHVTYSVILDGGLPYSVCDNFLTSKTELASAFYIHNTQRIKDAKHQYEHYISCCYALGIPDAQINLDKMLTADFLLANSDRHYNNFGAVRNSETLEWLMTAPLFDNGSSLWYNIDTEAITPGIKLKSMPFRDTHEEQITLVKDFSWLDITALAGIDDEFNELLKMSLFISSTRRDKLCFALRERVDVLRDITINY